MTSLEHFTVAATLRARARAEGYQADVVPFDDGTEQGWAIHIREELEGERRMHRGTIWVSVEGVVRADVGVPARIVGLVKPSRAA
jgi:hypothetical protein